MFKFFKTNFLKSKFSSPHRNLIVQKNLKFSSTILNENDLSDRFKIFDQDLCELNTFTNFQNFFYINKNLIDNFLEKKILFLDYFSTFQKNYVLTEDSDILIQNVLSDIKIDYLKSIDSIYVLSLMESLYTLNYYPNISYVDNKLWINLEYLILSTNFLNNISLENYGILLKCFQKFFGITDTTLSPEEIYEAIEYQIILKFRNEFIFNLENLEKYIEIFTLFGKNLEGSEELYNLFIDKIFTNDILKKLNIELVINLYFSAICIQMNICTKNKKLEIFILEFEELLINQKKLYNYIFTLNQEFEDILRWCFNIRKININKLNKI